MNESQVTIDGRPHMLPRPFMVIATQNPVEHHGTYPLPESQLDRFLMRLRIGYPDPASEREILRNLEMATADSVRPVLSGDDIIRLQDAVQRVAVEESLVDYMLAIVEKTRAHESLTLGVSPRGSQALYRAVQALALLEGPRLRHSGRCEASGARRCSGIAWWSIRAPRCAQRRADLGDRIIEEILSQIDVPL